MSRNTLWLISGLVVVLLGAAAFWGFVANGPPQDDFVVDIPDPNFWYQYPAAVVLGTVVTVDPDGGTRYPIDAEPGALISLADVQLLYESETSKSGTPAHLWPATTVEFDLVDGLAHSKALALGDRIIVMLGSRGEGDVGPWLVDLMGILHENGDVEMLNDRSGGLQVQLDHVAKELGVEPAEAFSLLARDVREMREASQLTGELPDLLGPAARAVRTAGLENPRAIWRATDWREREYGSVAVPRKIQEKVAWIPIVWTVDPSVAMGDSTLVIQPRDGTATSGTFQATEEHVENRVGASLGSDIEIVLRAEDDLAGEVITIVTPAIWEHAESLEISIWRDQDGLKADVTAITETK